MKKQLPLVGLIFLLTGCESDFEKCMSAELPRAETLAGIEAERELGRKLADLRDLHDKMLLIDNALIKWNEENPSPENVCSVHSSTDSWEKCNSEDNKVSAQLDEHQNEAPSAKRWEDRKNAEIYSLGALHGVSISNEEQLVDVFDDVFESYETLLEPQSAVLQCYNDYKCDEYSYSDDYLEVLEKAFDEAILNNTSAIAELVDKADLLATVTCNNNGIYE
jgi:hypothetical protein